MVATVRTPSRRSGARSRRENPQAVLAVDVGVRLCLLLRQHRHLGPSVVERGPFSEAADQRQPMGTAGGVHVFGEAGRELREEADRDPQVGDRFFFQPAEPRRSNADDRGSEPVQCDRGADDSRVARETLPPQRVADDQHGLEPTVLVGLIRTERPADVDVDAEVAKVVGGDDVRGPDDRYRVPTAQRHLGVGVTDEVGDGAGVGAIVEVVGVRDAAIEAALAGVVEQRHQPLWLGHRQWLQQQRIDKAVDHVRCRKPARQDDDGGDRQERLASQRPSARQQVPGEPVDESLTACPAPVQRGQPTALCVHGVAVAERLHRALAGCFDRDALGDDLTGSHLQVEVELVTDLAGCRIPEISPPSRR